MRFLNMEVLHLCCGLNSPTEHKAQLYLGTNWIITQVKFEMDGEYWPSCKINRKCKEHFLKPCRHIPYLCVLIIYKFWRNSSIPRRWFKKRDNCGEKLGLSSAPLQSDEWIRRGLIAFSWPLKEATLHNCRATLAVLNLCYSDKLQSTRGKL